MSAYVWDYSEGMGLMRQFWDARVALDPAAIALDEGRRFPRCRPEPIPRLFDGAGLRDVQVCAIDVLQCSVTSMITCRLSSAARDLRRGTQCP